MPRPPTRPRDKLHEPVESSDFLDWEPSETAVNKVLTSVRGLSVRDALLTLAATSDVLIRNSPDNWSVIKVQYVSRKL